MEKIVKPNTTFRKLNRFFFLGFAAFLLAVPPSLAQDDEEDDGPVRSFPAGGIRNGPLPGGSALPGPPRILPELTPGAEASEDDEDGEDEAAERERRREEARERAREARERRNQEREESASANASSSASDDGESTRV